MGLLEWWVFFFYHENIFANACWWVLEVHQQNPRFFFPFPNRDSSRNGSRWRLEIFILLSKPPSENEGVDLPWSWKLKVDLGVSKNNGTPKSSTFIGIFHYFHHPFWGIPNFWKHPFVCKWLDTFPKTMPRKSTTKKPEPQKAKPNSNVYKMGVSSKNRGENTPKWMVYK